MTARLRCKCSHGPSTHTGGHGHCWQMPCTCNEYRDPAELAGSIDRHPAGKALPQTADIYDYLRQKGEIQ